MIGTDHDDQLIVVDDPMVHPARQSGCLDEPEREVSTVQAVENLFGVLHREVDPGPGLTLPQLGQPSRQQVFGDRHARPDTDLDDVLAAGMVEPVAELPGAREQFAGMRGEQDPRGGRPGAAGVTFEQDHPGLAFEPGHHAAGVRLMDAHSAGGSAEAALVDRGHEHGQRGEVGQTTEVGWGIGHVPIVPYQVDMDACRIGGYRTMRRTPTVEGMSTPTVTAPATARQRRSVLPGVGASLLVAVVATLVNHWTPNVSALIITVVLGVVWANTVGIPQSWAPGLEIAAKKLLRLGIVLLGLQLVLGDIVALGWPVIVLVVCVVAIGVASTIGLGRVLGVPRNLTLLIGCGFSICGAAAVVAAASATDPDGEHEEDTVAAVALVVLFGSLMIIALPLAAHVFGLMDRPAGIWAGAAVHEVAQVVAVGGVIGGGALAVAVVVKLARVLLLAPVMAVLGVLARRDGTAAGRRPPLVPLFVVGFLAMVVLRSIVPIPPVVLADAKLLQTVLLAAAMFALGCGVRVRGLLGMGLRPVVLAAATTLVVSGTALVGMLLAG